MIESVTATPSDTNIALSDVGTTRPGYGVIKYDLDGPSDADATMSFGDFLDMVNPLQHIPVVSELYRSVTGDKINPVSRIAGDALYGGILGAASAGITAVASIGEEVFASSNDDESLGRTVIAGLFGSDADNAGDTTKLADAVTPTPNTKNLLAQNSTSPKSMMTASAVPPATSVAQNAFLQTPKDGLPASLATPTSASSAFASIQTARSAFTTAPATPGLPGTKDQMAQASAASPIPAAAAQAAAATSDPDLALALNQGRAPLSNAPYGGVMDTSMMQNAMQNQTMALALASSRSTMQQAHNLRNSRFATSPNTPTSPTSSTPSDPSTVANMTNDTLASKAAAEIGQKLNENAAALSTANSAATTTDDAATAANGQTLIRSLRTLKGLDQYRNSAQSMPLPGVSVDVTN